MLTLQTVNRRRGQLRQGTEHGPPCGRIARDVQAKAAFFGDEEGLDGPVLAVLLGPAGSAVLQLHQRLEAVRALLNRPEFLPAHPGEVDDRCYPFRKFNLRQPPVDDASQPDRRADSLIGLVLPEREELRQQPPELRNDRLPLCIVVRPQNNSRTDNVVRIEPGRTFQRACQELDDSGVGRGCRDAH